MTTKEFCEKLDALLEEEIGTVSPETNLRDTEWDSVSTMGFIALVNKEFGMTIPAKELVACRTVANLLSLVKEKLDD